MFAKTRDPEAYAYPNGLFEDLRECGKYMLKDFRDPGITPANMRYRTHEFDVELTHPLLIESCPLTVAVELDIFAVYAIEDRLELFGDCEVEVYFCGLTATCLGDRPSISAIAAMVDSPEYRKGMTSEEFESRIARMDAKRYSK